MAKKNAARKDAKNNEFDDSSYSNIRYSTSFDYDALDFTRAASLIAPRAKSNITIASYVVLVVIVGMLLINSKLLAPAIFMVLVWTLLQGLSRNWTWIQERQARSTTLALGNPSGERRHVVVTDDSVHTEVAGGTKVSYRIADLKHVENSELCILLSFGNKGYVYIPRSALSENRYRELGRFLQQ